MTQNEQTSRHIARFQAAGELAKAGEHAEAARIFAELLQVYPNDARLLSELGAQAVNMGDYAQAEQLLQKSLGINPQQPATCINRGIALMQQQRWQDALPCLDQAIMLAPECAEAYYNRAGIFRELGNHAQALDDLRQTLRLAPSHVEALINRGISCQALNRHEDAAASYEQALNIDPTHPQALYNYANTLMQLRQYEPAAAYYLDALPRHPQPANVLTNRGLALQNLKQNQDALDCFTQAIGIDPLAAEAYRFQAHTLNAMKRYEQAMPGFDKALALTEDRHFLSGSRLLNKLQICQWQNVQIEVRQLEQDIAAAKQVATPFAALVVCDDPGLQQKAAEIWYNAKFAATHDAAGLRYPEHDKIRIGYFSADFHQHPVAALTAELYESHDRNRFEITAFSFGPDTKDAYRERLKAGFDHFTDIRTLSDQQSAELARSLEIDIAVDLGGYTGDCRTGIFALRAAPLQLSYLGYLGTMGAPFMDYILADPVVITPASRRYFNEKVIYLPSYQVNDSRRPTPPDTFTRQQLDLPPHAFVYCCFNNSYKIGSEAFASWMRILHRVPGSVLFLYADNPAARENLTAAARRHGVDERRLVFGARLEMNEYLARYRQADLFLDTLPYNAGTTASDALWAGLPVLTMCGQAFAGRVAASLLTAAGLPELITHTRQDYEDLAVYLAEHPQQLAEIKQKLERNRAGTALFDTQSFTRRLERAYSMVYRRHQAGLQPEDTAG